LGEAQAVALAAPFEVCGRWRALRLTTSGIVRPMSHRDRCGLRGFDETMDCYPKLLELLAIGWPPPGAPHAGRLLR
jgi:hypothetical protein